MLPTLSDVQTELYRLGFSYYPSYWSTGARVVSLANDFSHVRVKLPHNWRTRNPLGVTFGGSIYAAVDPLYVVLLRHRLGDGFSVWDKAADVRFRKPVESTLYADVGLPDDEVAALRELAPGESTDRVYDVELVDGDGERHAEVEKTVYVRRDENDDED